MTFTKYESLRDRVVLVTGGASGIGEEFVKAFADNGARVAFFDLNEDAGQSLTKALTASARHAPLFVRCDVTRTDDLKAAISEVRQKLGPVSALINNAANDQRQVYADVTPDEFDATMAVNFRHIYFASQTVVPQMIELGGGSIVNMSSITWQNGRAGADGLCIRQGRRRRLHTFAGAAGRQASHPRQRDCARPRTHREAAAAVVSDARERGGRINNQFLPDAVMPADIANLALFLAADDSRMITRQTFSVNGGRT